MKAEKRKQLILCCAKTLFSTYGFYRTQISDITKKAKIARGTVYQYFNNKEDIFITLLENAYQQWEIAISKAVSETNLNTITPVDFLKRRIRTTVAFLVADPDICNIAMTMGFGLPSRLESVTRRIEKKIVIIAINDFKLALHSGHAREDLNTRHVAEMLAGAIFYCVYSSLLRAEKKPEQVDVEALTDEIVALFAPGIFKLESLKL